MSEKVNLTAQNRLIISGLILSTVLIIVIALFAIFNIQKKLNEGYQNFGQGISKTLAIESAEIIKDMPPNEVRNTLQTHSDLLLAGHSDIVLVEFRDVEGKLISSTKNSSINKEIIPVITVSSPLVIPNDDKNYGSVTVGLSGKIVSQISSTTRTSLMFVFALVWIVFAFVILINTYLITRELRILQKGVRKISTGEFGYKIESKDVSSEVADLFV